MTLTRRHLMAGTGAAALGTVQWSKPGRAAAPGDAALTGAIE